MGHSLPGTVHGLSVVRVDRRPLVVTHIHFFQVVSFCGLSFFFAFSWAIVKSTGHYRLLINHMTRSCAAALTSLGDRFFFWDSSGTESCIVVVVIFVCPNVHKVYFGYWITHCSSSPLMNCSCLWHGRPASQRDTNFNFLHRKRNILYITLK